MILRSGLSTGRLNEILKVGQKLACTHPGHPTVQITDIPMITQMQLSTGTLFLYLIRRVYFQIFDFTGHRYPVHWIPSNSDQRFQQLHFEIDVVQFLRQKHHKLILIYQNVTSKLTYLTHHHDDEFVKSFIEYESNDMIHTLLYSSSVANASAYLIRHVYMEIKKIFRCRYLHENELLPCDRCHVFFGRFCSNKTTTLCKYCCFMTTNRSECVVHHTGFEIKI